MPCCCLPVRCLVDANAAAKCDLVVHACHMLSCMVGWQLYHLAECYKKRLMHIILANTIKTTAAIADRIMPRGRTQRRT